MNVLVIAPHPDDEAIGCGGTIRLHANRGDRASVVFLTSGELGARHLLQRRASETRENEARRAAEILGIERTIFLRQPDWFLEDHIDNAACALVPALKAELPEVIYLPHSSEWHPDHRACLPIVQNALGHLRILKAKLRCYEVSTPMAEYDHVKNITEVMREKLKAVRAHASQVKQRAYPRAVYGLNQYRGVMAGRCRFAEVFQTL